MKRNRALGLSCVASSLFIVSGILTSASANAAASAAPAAHAPAAPKAAAPAAPKAAAPAPVAPAPAAATVGSAQEGLQLALADAAANKAQALAAAGNDAVAKRAAIAQYRAQIKAIRKAIAATQK